MINQHLREQVQATSRVSEVPTGLNAEFLNALPFEIREEVLRQERLENEHSRIRSRAADESAPSISVPLNEGALAKTVPGKGKPAVVHKESVHLMENSDIASLLRLVFMLDTSNKDILHRLLLNLCENSKSRNEILCLLLSVLSAGSIDLASVDRTFAQLSLKSKSKNFPLKEDPNTGPADGVPNVVAQRCLDALTHLTSHASSVGKYFLTESEAPKPLKSKGKKVKGKEKLVCPTLVFPVVVLLNLLEQPFLLNNSLVLEQLMRLLANVLRPLSIIAKKKFSPVDKKSEGNPLSHMDNDDTESAAKLKAEVKESKEKSDIKLPMLPESSICNVVSVLKDGISSSKSFQYTLSVIQYLCSYPSHLDIMTTQLLDSAQSLGEILVVEVDSLLYSLQSAVSPESLSTSVLDLFTFPSATQAKLLRILKTVDYIYSKADGTGYFNSGVAQCANYLSALQVYKDEFSTLNLDVMPSEMQILEKLYDQLHLAKLWQKLGEVMAIIDKKDGFIHVGTALLPFIEAYMVISKPSVSLRKRSHLHSSLSVPHVLFKQQSDLSEIENDSFLVFAEANKMVLNTMVRNNPSLMNGSFALLVQNPKVLEFDNKRTYFTQQLHKSDAERRNHQTIQINVRRQYVFEESYQQMQGRSGNAIKYGKLNVKFRDEEGVDAGGVTREWFSALALQMFNPDYALFRPSAADKVTYQPNRTSGINPDHLFYLKFVGRIIGKAIFDGRLLDAYFTRSFYKCMVSVPVDHKDMEAIDPEFYKSLDWILNNDITDILDLTFSLELDDFGKQKIIDLKVDGRNIPVTQVNKIEYVHLVTEQKLVVAIKDQIEAFLSGFREIIPRELVKIFNEQELELLISGLPDIDIDDWKNNTEYQNYSPSSPQIQWFWRAVRSFTQEERAKLIQFATGTSKVPLGGFNLLQGSTGIQKFQIHKEFSSINRLPSAHTW